MSKNKIITPDEAQKRFRNSMVKNGNPIQCLIFCADLLSQEEVTRYALEFPNIALREAYEYLPPHILDKCVKMMLGKE